MNGDSATFATWYESDHRSVLAAVSLFCVGDHSRAEDATNDACVEAYEKWDRVSAMHAPTAWVTRVAINNAKRGYRRRKRRIELLNGQRLDTAFTDTQQDIDLLNALGKLTKRQRSALVLRYIEDLSQSAVADEMDVALGTATATLTQARSRLRAELADQPTRRPQ